MTEKTVNEIYWIWEKWSRDPDRTIDGLKRRLREEGFKVVRSYRTAVTGTCAAGFAPEHTHIVIKVNDYEVILCTMSGYILYKPREVE